MVKSFVEIGDVVDELLRRGTIPMEGETIELKSCLVSRIDEEPDNNYMTIVACSKEIFHPLFTRWCRSNCRRDKFVSLILEGFDVLFPYGGSMLRVHIRLSLLVGPTTLVRNVTLETMRTKPTH